MRISDWSSDVCSSDLFIGSEGTLGVVTRVVVRLEEATSSRNSALVALTGFDEVTQLLKRLQRTLGGKPRAFEVMWGASFRDVPEPGFHRAPMDRHSPYCGNRDRTEERRWGKARINRCRDVGT